MTSRRVFEAPVDPKGVRSGRRYNRRVEPEDTGKRTPKRSGARRAVDTAWTFLPWPLDLLAVVVSFVATYVGIARRPVGEAHERKGG